MRALLLLLPIGVCALEMKPWLGNFLEVDFDSSYPFSYYDKVQDARHQLKRTSHDNLLVFDLGTTIFNWYVQFEGEFAHTPRMRWGQRSTAMQVRYLWLDDVAGDPVSLVTSGIFRYSTRQALKDVSSPYHAHFNGEINISLGKEWDLCGFWRWRTFGVATAGWANRGSPWVRALLSFEGNWEDRHQAQLMAAGYFGFGHEHTVDIHHFNGYARIHHQSIDIGAAYRLLLDEWGLFEFSYVYRPYARSFPENIQFFTLAYKIPFSIL